MKKVLSVIFVMVLVISMGITALALDVPGNTSNDVTATYVSAGEADTIYSVDVDWGALTFTYNASKPVWNPETHQFNETNGVWSSTESGVADKVTITNHSNAEVKVGFSYTIKNASAIAGSFDKPTFILADASIGGAATVDSSVLSLSGEFISGAAAIVGEVTVTFSVVD